MKQHFQRGSLLFEQGRYEEALGELYLELGQNSEDAMTHTLLAMVLDRLKRFPEATEHAERAIHLAPDQALGHFALAHILFDRNRFREAKAAIEEAIRLDPDEADHFAILSSIEQRLEHWRAALDAANQGLEIDPENTTCINLRAQALVRLGDRAGAAATMGEALARRPEDPYTHANQGWALLHAGKPYPAMEHFREALRLDPEMEWARAGIVEAMKARNFLYRWLLAYFLWMARLPSGARWGLIIGALVGQRVIGGMARKSPELAPFLWPLLYAYFAFVLLSWLAPSLFNLLLRLNRFGRYALSADQVRGANVLAASLAATLICLVAAIVTGSSIIYHFTLLFALLSLPASAIYVCEEGWPRQAMALVTLGLLAMLVAIIGVAVFEKSLPRTAIAAAVAGLQFMPMAMLGSQFLAMYLVNVSPRK